MRCPRTGPPPPGQSHRCAEKSSVHRLPRWVGTRSAPRPPVLNQDFNASQYCGPIGRRSPAARVTVWSGGDSLHRDPARSRGTDRRRDGRGAEAYRLRFARHRDSSVQLARISPFPHATFVWRGEWLRRDIGDGLRSSPRTMDSHGLAQ